MGKEKITKEEEIKNNTTASKAGAKEQKSGSKKTGKTKKGTKKSSEKEISELKQQLGELNDKYLRLFSEFDNYRKRTNAEKLELIKTASRGVIEGLLPVLDDFDRALEAFTNQEVDNETIKGVDLIRTKLNTFLGQKGLEPMDSAGKDFDTDWHDAITQVAAPSEDMKGKVVDVIQKGYLLNGTVIRHAKVVVGQ